MPRRSKTQEGSRQAARWLVLCEYASSLPREAWDDSQWFAGHGSCLRRAGARASGSRDQPASVGTGAAPTTDVRVCPANQAPVETTRWTSGNTVRPCHQDCQCCPHDADASMEPPASTWWGPVSRLISRSSQSPAFSSQGALPWHEDPARLLGPAGSGWLVHFRRGCGPWLLNPPRAIEGSWSLHVIVERARDLSFHPSCYSGA